MNRSNDLSIYKSINNLFWASKFEDSVTVGSKYVRFENYAKSASGKGETVWNAIDELAKLFDELAIGNIKVEFLNHPNNELV